MLDDIISKLKAWKETEDYKWNVKQETKKKKSLEAFVSTFTEEKISSMNIDEYVTGKGNKFSFCNWVEQELECYGSISGRTTAFEKFVIYWNKKENKYSFGAKNWKNRKEFGSTIEEIFNNVKKALLDIVVSTKNHDYDKISANPLNPQFKNKISFLYDSKNQIPIYSDNDLNTILTIFGIPFDKNEDRFIKHQKLFNFYNNNLFNKMVTPYLFMAFIYNWSGYRSELRGDEKLIIDTKEIKHYSLVDIQIEDLILKEKKENETKRRFIYSPGSEESKRITGRKAEDIVLEYLNAHAKELDANNITAWCNGENQDDGKGYDISYKNSDGTEIFIEVKGTKADLEDKVIFEMSANEYNFMREHKETYYIFFVNNVNKATIIKRLLGKDIHCEEPIKYKISFNSTEKIEHSPSEISIK